jgi:hypothetical protein
MKCFCTSVSILVQTLSFVVPGLNITFLQSKNINIPTPDIGGNPPIYMYSAVLDGQFMTDFLYNSLAQGKFIRVPTIMG